MKSYFDGFAYIFIYLLLLFEYFSSFSNFNAIHSFISRGPHVKNCTSEIYSQDLFNNFGTHPNGLSL